MPGGGLSLVNFTSQLVNFTSGTLRESQDGIGEVLRAILVLGSRGFPTSGISLVGHRGHRASLMLPYRLGTTALYWKSSWYFQGPGIIEAQLFIIEVQSDPGREPRAKTVSEKSSEQSWFLVPGSWILAICKIIV